MENSTATEMRKNRFVYTEAIKKLSLGGFCDVVRVPVQKFFDAYYALLFPLVLKEGYQTSSVIDLTDYMNHENNFLRVALFADSTVWNVDENSRPKTDENGDFSSDVCILAVFPEEGRVGFVTEDGTVFQSGDIDIKISMSF